MNSQDIISIVDEEEQKELSEEYGIELIEKIDEGSFGVVFKGKDLSDGSLCAVKKDIIKKQKENQKNYQIKDKFHEHGEQINYHQQTNLNFR